MSLLILVEHDNKNMHPTTKSVLSAGLQLEDKATLLIVGSECQSVAEEASTLKGVEAVWVVDDAVYKNPVAEQISDLIFAIASSFSMFIAPASTFGKNIMPRLAAKLDATQISDVTKILDKQTFEHPVYAGNAIETVRVLDDLKLLTIRPTAFEPISESQPSCCVEKLDKVIPQDKAVFVSHQLSQSERPELGSAKIVVSGGRGLQSAEKFKLVEELADALGAAIGASRAAVDAGFVSNDYQVGQTGKIVAPALYIAIGISGAVQHMAGMKDSKTIVAINKDEDAPIFQIADYGLVGDLFELVPEFIELLKKE